MRYVVAFAVVVATSTAARADDPKADCEYLEITASTGKSPAIEASLVKDLGTIYQQDLPEVARALAESDATTEEDMADFLDVAQYATMMAPSYTIQGGTTQVLRGIVARGLGLR